MSPIPCAALVERHAPPAENIQGTTDGEIDLAVAEMLDKLEILDVATTASVGDGDAADRRKICDQFFVDASLKTFGVRRVDQEFAASVMVCHLSMATLHPSPTLRQLRSMTNSFLSPSKDFNADCSRSRENDPEGNKKEVMMTYRTTVRPRRQGLTSSLFIARAEHDDVAASQVMFLVQLRKVYARSELSLHVRFLVLRSNVTVLYASDGDVFRCSFCDLRQDSALRAAVGRHRSRTFLAFKGLSTHENESIMAAEILGKRKRRVSSRAVKNEEYDPSNDDDMRARFQKAFEAKFKPLPQLARPANIPSAEELPPNVEDNDDESDWDGLSSAEEEIVEVINHHTDHDSNQEEQKREMKAFMSSKPPSSIDSLFASTSKRKKSTAAEDNDDTETANLKHDLALQRLLKESHLLDSESVKSGISYAPQGKARLKALDLRMQDIGAKKAILEQEKMPMAFRKGIAAKGVAREAARRKDAAENGVILERARSMGVKGGKAGEKRRERGMGGPGVGRFQGGTLKLSQRDVRAIEGPRKRDGGKKGRR
nr:uncharacterized protein c3f10.08c [Quercus suber]